MHSYASPYEVLGVAQTATPQEIKKAYRQQARQTHPDLNPGSKGAEERFKQVAYAYEVLSDPVRRKGFDEDAKYRRQRAASPASSRPMQDPPSYRPDEYSFVWSYPDFEELRLRRQWQQFVAKSFMPAEFIRLTYIRWQWVASLISCVLIYKLFTNEQGWMWPMYFMLSSRAYPDGSINPIIGSSIGMLFAALCVAGMMLHAALKNRQAFRTSKHFRNVLFSYAGDTFEWLGVTASIGGMAIGHYFF